MGKTGKFKYLSSVLFFFLHKKVGSLILGYACHFNKAVGLDTWFFLYHFDANLSFAYFKLLLFLLQI
jgi:hypothetical protein